MKDQVDLKHNLFGSPNRSYDFKQRGVGKQPCHTRRYPSPGDQNLEFEGERYGDVLHQSKRQDDEVRCVCGYCNKVPHTFKFFGTVTVRVIIHREIARDEHRLRYKTSNKINERQTYQKTCRRRSKRWPLVNRHEK